MKVDFKVMYAWYAGNMQSVKPCIGAGKLNCPTTFNVPNHPPGHCCKRTVTSEVIYWVHSRLRSCLLVFWDPNTVYKYRGMSGWACRDRPKITISPPKHNSSQGAGGLRIRFVIVISMVHYLSRVEIEVHTNKCESHTTNNSTG